MKSMQKSPAGIKIAKNNKHFLKRLNSAHIPQSFLNENIYDFLHAIVIRPEYKRLNTNNNNKTTGKACLHLTNLRAATLPGLL